MADVEREIKLELADGQPRPDPGEAAEAGGARVEAMPERQLDADYYDTSDLRLTRWGCSYRNRSDEGWLVKLPSTPGAGAGGGADDNVDVVSRAEIPIDDDGLEPPTAGARLVAGFTRGAPLAPVARVVTTRQPFRLTDAIDDEPIAELVDDEVRVERPGRPSWDFSMVEIELAEGRRGEDVASVMEHYLAAGAKTTQRSKVARALGDAAATAPDVVVPPVSATPTAREVIHAAIAGAVHRLVTNLPGARLGDGPDGVHQSRVSLRRLRSDLHTFGPLLEPSRIDRLAPELRWLGDRLGEVRDADVRLEVLHELVEDESSLAPERAEALFRVLDRHLRQAHTRLLRALDSDRCINLLDLLVETAQDPPTAPQADDPADENLPGLVIRPWRKLRRAVADLDDDPTDAALHRIRIRAKRCRYAAEAVEPVSGKPARQLARSMKRVQDSLGDLNDAIVIGEHLDATSVEHPELGFVAGGLAGLLTARARHCRDDFFETWRRAKHIELPR